MGKLRWTIVVGLIAFSVGLVAAQRQRATVEQRITALEMQMEELFDMQSDIGKLRRDKNYDSRVEYRMNQYYSKMRSIRSRLRSNSIRAR